MIIKKKTLNRITGEGEQVAEQPDFAASQGNDYSQTQQQYNSDYQNDDMYIDPDGEEQASSNYSNQQKTQTSPKEEEINLFDLDNIDFSQRQERRRGDRRRGFRRVDDRNLVSRAREEADSIRQSALNEGYQAGIDEAKSDIELLKNSLSSFMQAKQEVFEYIAPDILEISVDIAQKIIKKEIEQDPQTIFGTIVEVLKTLSKDETKVTLQVSPTEVNEVKQAVPELIELAGIDTKVVVLANEEVSEGGCLVTTNNGIVDATIESRIKVVMQALREI
jgi:flagellar assembly protein FliH